MRVRWVADTRGQTKQAHAHHTQPTRHLHPHPRLHPHPHPHPLLHFLLVLRALTAAPFPTPAAVRPVQPPAKRVVRQTTRLPRAPPRPQPATWGLRWRWSRGQPQAKPYTPTLTMPSRRTRRLPPHHPFLSLSAGSRRPPFVALARMAGWPTFSPRLCVRHTYE